MAMKILYDLLYDEKNTLDFYLPEKSNFTTVVYFHGGGLENGDKSKQNYVEISKAFAENGFGFASVNYTLYPNAKFPSYLTECAKAVAFAKEQAVKLGGSGKILIAGQSAGAWITLMLCFNQKYLANEGIDNAEVIGWISDSAQTTSHFNVIKYEMGISPKTQLINEYSPMFYLNEQSSFTKLFLIYYTNDRPCRPEQNKLFYSAVKNFNPDADISIVELVGKHCAGSSKKDEDGNYPFVLTAFNWLKEKNIY